MANKMAVGSIEWIRAEKDNLQELLKQEREEIVFPAQHELEWLNEHMTEIFNKSHVDVANVFKTPGKLRGKTPRTARKRNAEPRIPLSDVFSSKQPVRTSPIKVNKAIKFTVAEDADVQKIAKSQTDSGYHGSSQVEEPRQQTPDLPIRSPLRTMAPPDAEILTEARTTEGSFHSAKEDQTMKVEAVRTHAQSRETQQDPCIEVEMQDAEMPHFDEIGSPSDQSTPDRPVVRKKSSMTFASLPAREPLKTSIGTRMSRTSHIAPKTISVQPTIADPQDMDPESSDSDSNIEILGHDESDTELQATKEHSKSSTQRLHERIEALGKAPPARPSKSIPSAAVTITATAPTQKAHEQDDDDDWIKPLSTDKQQIDGVMEDEFDVRAPELIAHEERMRLISSSPQRPVYGHAKSASTATLVSPAKTAMAPPASPAKSISISNPAMSSSTPQGSPNRFMDGVSASKSKLHSIMKTAKGLFTSSASISAAAKMETITPRVDKAMPGMYPILDKPLPASPAKDSRRTRSSAEREKRHQKDLEAMQKMDDQLEKAREKEKQKVKAASPQKEDDRMAARLNRPIRPGRELSKSKPQPVSIRIGTISQRMPLPIANNVPEILPAEPKRPGLTNKTSTTSLQSSASTMTLKTSVNSQAAKPRALLAAERKKEQDEKEVQRKLEQKRELEKKRAAQQEEVRRREHEQRAEVERKERERIAQEKAKRQAQQQAIERKRLEASRKAEQQRVEREGSRPPSRLGQQASRPLINHQLPTNPAKPAKRPVEEESLRSQAPKFGAASQQGDAKRRRTEDETEQAPRPTMSGAPIRQSQLGKKPSIFNHPAYQQQSLNQFPQPPRNHQMAQFATSKIPFAEPVTAPSKTPVSAYQHRTIQAIRSSPQYQNGETIHLPEIPTDSEDEDSEDEGNAFPIPDWATPGHLTEQLIRQEGIDGDAVFGPIAPLKMEEIFAKGNKERLKRLRDRTSSANWAMSGDGLTLEEVRADREQREKMRKEGGWRYGT